MDPKDRLIIGYKMMMERLSEALHGVEEKLPPVIHDLLENVRQRSVEKRDLTHEESESVVAYLKRDLEEAVRYTDSTGKELKDWLSFDVLLIEKELWDLFSSVADKTTVEWLQFKESVPPKKYHSQEIVGMGALQCTHCGEVLQFYKPTVIPPCPNCQSTIFKRFVQ